MFRDLSDPLLIPKIVKLAEEYLPDTSPDMLRNGLIKSLENNEARTIVYGKKGNIQAYIFATIDRFDMNKCVFIQSCVIHPVLKEIGHELLARIRNWGKAKQAKFIYFITGRNPQGFMRKYKFEKTGEVLRRGIE